MTEPIFPPADLANLADFFEAQKKIRHWPVPFFVGIGAHPLTGTAAIPPRRIGQQTLPSLGLQMLHRVGPHCLQRMKK
jgi:hypothetical protein